MLERPVATPGLGADSVKLGAVRATGQLPATAGLFDPPVNVPGKERTWQDYQEIFKWVEKVTGAPIAYQDPNSQHAYLKAIKGKPQEYYDSKGFLSSLGVKGVETYGRDDSGVHNLLKTIKYSPNSSEVSKPLQIAQKAFYWFFMHFPKTFDKIATLTDKYYFERKDQKNQSWLKVEVPQPAIKPDDPRVQQVELQQNYSQNVIAQSLMVARPRTTQELFDGLFKLRPPAEISLLFEADFHMGTPKPGETPQNYGTYAIARRLGFNEQQAINFATADYDMDLNNTAYGDTDAFPNAMPSKHFNLNKATPEKGDTRYIWAQRHLDAAIELARRGRYTEAEREIGYGLHGIQDSFAHGHIRLASHAITDNIPDGVDYNPVAAYEATLATIGYLNKYMQAVYQV
ncbi:MAG: hypothetical protein ACAI44_01435 [Candidatus Sericytochromatia bacterium]